MKVFICVDNDNGMLFNNRRQSRDLKVVEKAMEISQSNLLITEFSSKLFGEFNIVVNNDMLDMATEQEFCFVENKDISPYIYKIDKIYIFKWNRRYPSDFIFDCSMLNDFQMIHTEDFEGNSHEKITLEIWGK